MKELAKHAEFDVRDQQLVIDGQPLPWLIERNSVELATRDDGMIGVRLTILINETFKLVDPAPAYAPMHEWDR